jgi:hypothetical protein
VAAERVERDLAVAGRCQDGDFRIGLEATRQQAANDRAVIDHHEPIRLGGTDGLRPAGARRAGRFGIFHKSPTCANFAARMSLSNGFMMYSFAPAPMAS